MLVAISPVTNTPNQPLRYDAESIARYKRLHAPAHTDDELLAFFAQCERTQLDPWSRQIYTIKRTQYVNGSSVEKAMTQVSIDGLRLQAERSGKYLGQNGPWWCGTDGKWVDVWVKPMNELMAAKVGIFRAGYPEPVWGVARFDAYAVTKKSGELTAMWLKMGDVMIAKCAEALGLRKARPAELSNLYTTEEMGQADNPTQSAPAAAPKADDMVAKLQASVDANAAAAEAIAKAKKADVEAIKAVDKALPAAPKAAPKETPAAAPSTTPNTEGFKQLEEEITSMKTPEKATASIPVLLALAEPERSAAMSIFKKHRIAMRWETGKVNGAIQVRPMNIMEWNSIERAEQGLVIIEAMEGAEKAEALEALEVKCFENKWKLTKSPKLAVRA